MIALGLDAERIGAALAARSDRAAPAVPAERQRLETERLLGQRERHGRPPADRAGLSCGRCTRDTWDGDAGYIQFGDDPTQRLTKIEIQGRWQDGTEPISDDRLRRSTDPLHRAPTTGDDA